MSSVKLREARIEVSRRTEVVVVSYDQKMQRLIAAIVGLCKERTER